MADDILKTILTPHDRYRIAYETIRRKADRRQLTADQVLAVYAAARNAGMLRIIDFLYKKYQPVFYTMDPDIATYTTIGYKYLLQNGNYNIILTEAAIRSPQLVRYIMQRGLTFAENNNIVFLTDSTVNVAKKLVLLIKKCRFIEYFNKDFYASDCDCSNKNCPNTRIKVISKKYPLG